MKNLNIFSPREYIRHLLALRHQTLLQEGATDRKAKKR